MQFLIYFATGLAALIGYCAICWGYYHVARTRFNYEINNPFEIALMPMLIVVIVIALVGGLASVGKSILG